MKPLAAGGLPIHALVTDPSARSFTIPHVCKRLHRGATIPDSPSPYP